ncbi:uncharacterized protein LOC144352647 [Saccoglossus kowalevskii]
MKWIQWRTDILELQSLIRELTSPDAWKYVNTASNPSDDASRGITARQLIEDSNWLTGPDFLWNDKSLSATEFRYECTSDTEEEMRREMKRTSTVLKTNSLTACSDGQLINRFDQYSSWDASKRAAANCLRLKAKMLRATKTINRKLDLTDVMSETNTPLTVQDLAEGEKAIIREVQSRAFQKEIQILKEMKLVGNPQSRNQLKARNIQFRKSSTIYKLNPFIDDQGLLRVGGRIQKSCQLFEIKHPVILPKNIHITTLIVRHFHEQINHMGRGCTHNYIRQHGYWIISGSYTVSKLINQCVTC